MKKALLITALILATSPSIAYADTYSSVDSNGKVVNSIVCDASVCGANGSWNGIGPDGNKLVLQTTNSSAGVITQQDKQVTYSQSTNNFTVITSQSTSTFVAPTPAPQNHAISIQPPVINIVQVPVASEIVDTSTITTVDCTVPSNALDPLCIATGDPVPYDISLNPIPIDPSELNNVAYAYAVTDTQLVAKLISQQATKSKLNSLQGKGVQIL